MNVPKNREDLAALEAESGVKLPYESDISVLGTIPNMDRPKRSVNHKVGSRG